MSTITKLKLREIEIPKSLRSEEDRLEFLLRAASSGPITWAKNFVKLLELRGVWRVPGPKAQVNGGISPTVGLIAEELGVPRSTAFRRVAWAQQLAAHPKLARQVDDGEIPIRAALEQIGAPNGIRKPDLGNGVSHPARYSAELIEVFREVLAGYVTVLDPFAGTGLIHKLQEHGHDTIGVELEPEWAKLHEATEVGDARNLAFADESFDAICTSPTFGNRMADAHDARDAASRRSYTHDLGRKLSPGNSGLFQWGPKYREFHETTWFEALRVLRRGGRFVLDSKDHIRKGKRQFVSGWHVSTLCSLGADLLFHVEVETSGMKAGSNGDLRCPEYVYVFEKDG